MGAISQKRHICISQILRKQPRWSTRAPGLKFEGNRVSWRPEKWWGGGGDHLGGVEEEMCKK